MRTGQYPIVLIILFSSCIGVYSNLFSSIAHKGLSCLNTDALKVENLIQPRFWDDKMRHAIMGTQETVERIIDDILRRFPEFSNMINEFRSEVDQVVTSAKEFLEHPRFADMNMHDVVQKWAEQCEDVYHRLQKEFQEPLPEDMDEKMKQREKIITTLFNESQELFIRTIFDIRPLTQEEQESIGTRLSLVSEKLKKIILVACKMIDDHPSLVFFVSIISLLIPPGHFLRPLLLLFGFGPLGPVKGSAAAWAQRAFWGATATKGSWSAILQSIAM